MPHVFLHTSLDETNFIETLLTESMITIKIDPGSANRNTFCISMIAGMLDSIVLRHIAHITSLKYALRA